MIRILAFAHCCPGTMRYLSSSLRRRPQSRHWRTWRAAFGLHPGLRRGDQILSLSKFKAHGCLRFSGPARFLHDFTRTAMVRSEDVETARLTERRPASPMSGDSIDPREIGRASCREKGEMTVDRGG